MHEARLDGSAFFSERIQNLWYDIFDEPGKSLLVFGPTTIGYEVSFEPLHIDQIQESL